MHKLYFYYRFAKVLSLALIISGVFIQTTESTGDPLIDGFMSPPSVAHPRAYWYWMNGNISQPGITADLEWMSRVGITGVQLFDISIGVPQVVEKRVDYLTPEWNEAIQHAGREAHRLGIDVVMAGCGGWSQSGGPQVKPNEAMKKMVWSETAVKGSQKLEMTLPLPPTNNGLFQNLGNNEIEIPEGDDAGKQDTHSDELPTFYADSHVIAFRTPSCETNIAKLNPKITWSEGSIDGAALVDGDIARQVLLPIAKDGPATLKFEFKEPFTARAITIAAGEYTPFGGPVIPPGEVQYSVDGEQWNTLVTLPGPAHLQVGFPVRTYAFLPVTARYFRVNMVPVPKSPFDIILEKMRGIIADRSHFKVAEINLHSAPRVHFWHEKAVFSTMFEYETAATPEMDGGEIAIGDVIDLTGNMDSKGVLQWDVPEGDWSILRMGYSLTGKTNGPATPASTGFEVDKLNKEHVQAYMTRFMQDIKASTGEMFGTTLSAFHFDSWEAGLSNWTEDILEEFERRRGYDPVPYLPTLTGRVVGSSLTSDRFLWDFRRTVADLIIDNHYGALAEVLHDAGLEMYAEAMGAWLQSTVDSLQAKGRVDVPMGEFWMVPSGKDDNPEYQSDVKEAASAGHIYNKPIIAVEAFTSQPLLEGWAQTPFDLKPVADRYFARGMNRVVHHVCAHQPFVDGKHKPGMTLFGYGQHLSRKMTWAEQFSAWNDYLTRTSYLLQQGKFVADILYYYGEGVPVAAPFWKELHPSIPEGYDFDYVNTEVILDRLTVVDGQLVLPDGMRYSVLVLPSDLDQLTLPVARKLKALVEAGATMVAPRPKQSPSLVNQPRADREIRQIAAEVWGAIDGKSVKDHAFGKGNVSWGRNLAEVLDSMAVTPDVVHTRPSLDTDVRWIHRRTDTTDLYFLSNQLPISQTIRFSLRVEDRVPELWYPDTSGIESVDFVRKGDRVELEIAMEPHGSVFVILRDGHSEYTVKKGKNWVEEEMTVSGPWSVTFAPDLGAPESIELEELISWTDHPIDGVKHFSGTATYHKTVNIPDEWLREGHSVILDLGEVHEFAEVEVNGEALGGVLWKPPFQLEISAGLVAGENELTINVTNLWPNRIIGDQSLPEEKRISFTVYPAYEKDAPLLESGLLGDVELRLVSRKTVK